MNANTRDNVKLLLTAIGIVALAGALLMLIDKFEPQWFSHRSNWKWIRFSTVTIAFVIVCLKTYWKARRHVLFWAILVSVLMLHGFGVGYFYYAGDGLPFAFFGPVVALEWALMAYVIHRTLGIEPNLKGLEGLSLR